MTNTHSIRSMMSLSPKARSRAYALAALALTAAAVGCKNDKLLQVSDPDVLNVSDYQTPAGANALRIGVVRDFTTAFDGGTDAFSTVTGNLADEMLASDTFDGRLTINARKSVEVNSETGADYTNMQKARAGAARAIGILAKTAPTPTYNRGELYMLLGYTELFLGEGWCPGVPLSNADSGLVYGQQLTTDAIMAQAIAHFDTALTLADTSKRVKYGSEIGRGRALMNIGKFTDAATAVADVPQNFIVNTSHSSASTSNGIWSATTSGASRYRLVSGEGKNGLPFLSAPGSGTGSDARIPWSTSTRVGFSSQFTAQPNQSKFGQYSDGVLATGVEAQLIKLEAQLQANTQAARDAVYASLNQLRTGGAPIGGASSANVTVPAMSSGAPTTNDAAIDLLYKERAYWMWLTGHRLGDMRRLVRIYKRDSESVFPTGALTSPLDGTYGTSTAITIPFAERNNPNFKGCLDGK